MEMDMDDMDMAPFEDEAEESDGKENANDGDGEESKGKKRTVKPKKVSTRLGTLDDMVSKLFGDRGLKNLIEEVKTVKFKGEGHEFRDLDILVAKYEYWAHRLYPRLKFTDAIEKLERIGEKREVKVRCSNIKVNEDGTAVQEGDNQEGQEGDGAGLDFELGPGCTLAMDNDDEEEDDDMNGVDINDLLSRY